MDDRFAWTVLAQHLTNPELLARRPNQPRDGQLACIPKHRAFKPLMNHSSEDDAPMTVNSFPGFSYFRGQNWHLGGHDAFVSLRN